MSSGLCSFWGRSIWTALTFLSLYLMCLFSSCLKTFVCIICSQQFDFDMLWCKYVCMHECVCIFILLVVCLVAWFFFEIFIKSERCSDIIFPNLFFVLFPSSFWDFSYIYVGQLHIIPQVTWGSSFSPVFFLCALYGIDFIAVFFLFHCLIF